jgi:hypothetical protein
MHPRPDNTGSNTPCKRFAVSRYYWPGMKNTGSQHIRKCAPCQRYNPTNQKPAGLLQTPALQQRFEVLAIDLFRPLPPGPQEERWIFIIEDYATRWVELFALIDATVENCAWVLVNEVFLRYGLPRCLISDNGTQFISNVMQQITFCLNIDHKFTPVYHPSKKPSRTKEQGHQDATCHPFGKRPWSMANQAPSGPLCCKVHAVPGNRIHTGISTRNVRQRTPLPDGRHRRPKEGRHQR